MIRRLLATWVAFIALVWLGHGHAQFNGCSAGFCNRTVSGFTASCTQSSNFIARTSGQDNAHKTAYDNLICGLVNQSSTISGTLFSRLDGLWMLRGADSTVILLNLIQNAFNLTSNGTITFSANAGVTSNGTTGYYNTGFNPSTAGGQYTLNSMQAGVCYTQSPSGTTVFFGAYDGTNVSFLANSAGSQLFYLNETAGDSFVSTATGLWNMVRTGASATALYLNGSSQKTGTNASSVIPNLNDYILADNQSGTAAGFSSVQHTMAVVGAQYSATDVSNFRTLIAAYMAAIGSAAC